MSTSAVRAWARPEVRASRIKGIRASWDDPLRYVLKCQAMRAAGAGKGAKLAAYYDAPGARSAHGAKIVAGKRAKKEARARLEAEAAAGPL